jgi:hypothetical protein
MINVESLMLFKPSMLDGEDDHQVLPTIEDFAPHILEELEEFTILRRKEHVTHRGQKEIWQINLKGKTPRRAKWYEWTRLEIKFPHVSLESFGDQNPPNGEV